MNGRNKKVIKKVLLYVALFAISIVWVIPIFTLIATAIKGKAEFYTGTSLFSIPENIAWSNFVNAFTKGRLFMYMKNDLIVSCVKVPLGIVIEAMAAFALTRLNIKHKTGTFIFFLIGMMLPLQTALVPINVVYSKLGLLNTYHGLLFVYIGFGISFGILILRGFFSSIPKELDDAAYIDGCNKWQLFCRIIIPVSKPAIATLIITDFLATWNEYLLASVIINDNSMKTVPPGILTFVGEHSTDYGYLCAGVLISVIPILIIYLLFQRYFVEGMAGAVKS